MKKEIIVAIIMGLFLGLIITFGIYQARTSLVPSSTLSPLDTAPSPTPTDAAIGSLVITSPEDESITDTSSVTIAGTTSPDSFVAVTLNDKPHITTADTSGNFSIQDDLEDGSNVIQVLSINSDGDSVKKEVTVIYTTKPLIEEEEQEETATESAQTDN